VTDLRGALPTRSGTSGRYPLRDVRPVDLAVIHYTASSPSTTVRGTAGFQTGPDAQLDFPAIAYHLFVEASGAVYWCHDFDRRTWGSDGPGVNERGVHICYSGNRAPTAEQLGGIRTAIRFAQHQLGRSLTVEGHKDRSSTSCPGPHWPSWRAAVLP